MAEVSQDVRESARKIETALRNALADMGQARVADKMNVSESTVSRMKDADIEKFALFVAALNCSVVGKEQRVISASDLQVLKHLAARGLPHVGGGA
ncbi:CII family transcriptional regulator [Comamonas sp. J-3]|uniref:CII family transcriptional regulator n=1 Tax=Comamonas trifloxystrobinivorans TaxID=3350256 RepID=UPI00372CD0F5